MKRTQRTDPVVKHYYYTIVSNHPMGLTVNTDYGNLVIEAYGDNSNMREGGAVTSAAPSSDHVVTLAFDFAKVTDDEVKSSKPPLRHLRIVK